MVEGGTEGGNGGQEASFPPDPPTTAVSNVGFVSMLVPDWLFNFTANFGSVFVRKVGALFEIFLPELNPVSQTPRGSGTSSDFEHPPLISCSFFSFATKSRPPTPNVFANTAWIARIT